jgi:DNA-directed RNA polymerase specialized sigma subunit
MLTTSNTQQPLYQKSEASAIQEAEKIRQYSTVIKLRDEKNLTFRRIGEIMGYSRMHTSQTYHKAREFFKTRSGHQPGSYSDQSAEADHHTSQKPIERDEMVLTRDRLKIEKLQTVLVLREEMGLTFADIAEQMGFSNEYAGRLYREAVIARNRAADQERKQNRREGTK